MNNMQGNNENIMSCPVCGGKEFAEATVLWPELINAWQLSPYEVGYIDRQQGFHCKKCNNNLRAMGLAAAILDELAFTGSLLDLCNSRSALNILEINRAGGLTVCLERLNGHKLIEYPDFDMQDLFVQSNVYDMVIHSDTLEHVPNPVRGLAECHRVLKNDGKCIFTVPIIIDRMSRSRAGAMPSYHGRSAV